MLKYFFLLAAACLSTVVDIYSQDDQINASVSSSSVILGNAFTYTITGDFSGDVELPVLKGVKLVSGPSTFVSQQSSYVNGKIESRKTVTYTYTMLAMEEGDFLIPPSTITSGRKKFLTNEVKISVIKASTQNSSGANNTQPGLEQEAETVFIRQIPSKSTVYQGEQFVFSTKIYTQEALNISNFKSPGLDGFWRNELQADQNAGQENLNGKIFLTQVIKRDLLTAQKSGSIKIEPADIECMIRKRVSGSRQNAFNDPFFGDAFFDRYENVPQAFKTNSPVITVKPLPGGAPEGFNGAVGTFSFKVSIDKENLKVNDAVTLKVFISGSGNLDLLKPVIINFPPDLDVFDPKSVQDIKHTENGSSGNITYEFVLIPRHAGNFRIPPVSFSWFDPDQEKYISSKSKEFSFEVAKSENEDDAYLSSNTNRVQANQGGKDVLDLGNDIRYINMDNPGLKTIGKSVYGSMLFVLAYVVPLLVLFGLILLRKERIRRNADLNAVRNRKARRLAKKRLKMASLLMKTDDKGFYDEILKALWGYLSDKLNVSVSELSRERIASELQNKNLDIEVLNSLWALLDDCEIARYASDRAGDKLEIYNQSIKLISILQEKIS